jgi:hypothetical protein
MQPVSKRLLIGGAIVVHVAILGAAACHVLPSMGANGLLRPARNRMSSSASQSGPAVSFQGDAGRLAGWWFPSVTARRATVIYLHGVADNRGSSLAAARRLTTRGFDVVAYDSRAVMHGRLPIGLRDRTKARSKVQAQISQRALEEH